MAEHEATESGGTARTERVAAAPRKPREPLFRVAEVRGPVVNFLAGLIRWVGLLFALVLVVHVILTIGEANPANGITRFFHSWADFVALGFKDLFLTPEDAKLQVLVNYGVAAIVWLVVTAIVARLLRRLA